MSGTELISYWEENLKLLKDRWPDLAEQISLIGDPSPDSFKVYPAKNGMPALEVSPLSGGNPIRFHSAYDPIKEVKRRIDSLKGTDSDMLCFLGMGLGYLPLEIIKSNVLEIHKIIIIEADLQIFKSAMTYMDLSPLLNYEGTVLSVEESPDEIIAHLKSLEVEFFRGGLKIIDHVPSLGLYPDWYGAVRNMLQDIIRHGHVDFKTSFLDGHKFQENILHNLPWIFTSTGVVSLKDSFKGKPAILVAAGPSLDDNVEELKKAKGKALILCVDTAYRILLKHNILPDIVVSIDAGKLSMKHFEGIPDIPGVYCLFDPEVYPGMLRKYKWPRFVSDLKKINLFKVWDHYGEMGEIPKGATVAQTSFYLARYTGADPIIFMGQDLSYPKGLGITHADGAALRGSLPIDPENPEMLLEKDPFSPGGLRKVAPIWVDGVKGEKVATVPNMYSYLRELEHQVALTDARCIDATEGGAVKRGMDIMPLRDAINEFCFQDTDVAGTLATLYKKQDAKKLLQLKDDLRNAIEVLNVRGEMCRKAKNRCDSFLKDASKVNFSGNKVAEGLLNMREYLQRIMAESLFYALIQQSMIGAGLAFTSRDVKTIGNLTIKEARRNLEKYKKLFDEFSMNAVYFSKVLENVLAELDNNLSIGNYSPYFQT